MTRNTRFLLSLFVFLLGAQTKAEVLHWPQVCPSGQLKIENLDNKNVSVWLQKFSPELVEETQHTIQAKNHEVISINQKNQIVRFSLLHFSSRSSVKATLFCYNNSYEATPYEGGQMYFSFKKNDENKLWIQNLFSELNLVQIRFFNKHNQLVETQSLSLNAYEQKTIKPSNSLNWTIAEVSAQSKYAAFKLHASGLQTAYQVLKQTGHVDDQATYFLVEPRNGLSDSFVIKIKDSLMIQKAREQILRPDLEKIVFGKIQKGHDGYNQNWNRPEKSFWSWSVTEVTNISDIGSTACNGLPQVVEDRINSWLTDPGRICFWNYRIKKELTPQQIESRVNYAP